VEIQHLKWHGELPHEWHLSLGTRQNADDKSLRKDGIKPVIPGRSNRKKRIRHDKQAYKDRNVIERCYCRLKDFRRIATRYDKLARNYFSALCLVAAVAFWL
jgi:transposase